MAAEASVTSDITEIPEVCQWYEIRIPRKHIIIPPAALRATKEFERAIRYALQLATDSEKFNELQKVFKEFGYYYPYWIITGWYYIRISLFLTFLKVVDSGGDLSLLRDDYDVDGWMESTTTRQDLIVPFDFNPIYDLLEDKVSSEVQRIYRAQCDHLTPQVDSLSDADNSTASALVPISKTSRKVGVTKDVHFGGYLSEEEAVELVNETDIAKFMRSVSLAGKPRVECVVRHTSLGTSINTHAFLPSDSLDESENDSGFVKAAIASQIESNGGELQPSMREGRYFVMYVTYRELVFDSKYIKGTDNFKQSVIKALGMKSDMEKYHQLQKVFRRFGYYYPSSISLGGRLVHRASPNELLGVWPSKKGVESIDILFKKNDLLSITQNPEKIEAIGGSSIFTGCQDWIDSIRNNQTRTQFGSLRPIYELLEDEQRSQVLQLFDGNQNYIDGFPEIPRGLHFDGTEAGHQAIEFTKDKAHSGMIMLRSFLGHPNVERTKRYAKGFKGIEKYLSLDIETSDKLPGSFGFVLGSEGAYKERCISREHHYSKTESLHDVAYPTQQFKEAINKALLVGREDQDTYLALQDVFQLFGYYYPSSIQIGIIICAEYIPAAYSILIYQKPKIVEIIQSENDNREDSNSESCRVVVKTDQSLSKETVINAIEKSLANSGHWSSIGGDSSILLSNDVKSWINTVEANQTVTQFRGLKPIYELLAEDQRHKVQQTYENVILEDGRVLYGYLLEVEGCDQESEDKPDNCLEISPISTEELFDKLLAQVFPNSNTAIEFCRSMCADYGFSIIEEKVTDKIICLYCSLSALPECKLHALQDEKDKDLCQWGVMLFKNDKAQWQFQKFAHNNESMHSHTLTTQETESYCAPKPKRKSRIAVKPVAEFSVYEQGTTNAHYVRYGDIVRLWEPEYPDGGKFISAHGALGTAFMSSLTALEFLRFKKRMKNSKLDLLWRIIPYSLTSDEDESEADYKLDEGEKVADNYNYDRNNDIVMFESQSALKLNIQACLCFDSTSISGMSLGRFTKAYSGSFYIRHINQYAFLKNQVRGKEITFSSKTNTLKYLPSNIGSGVAYMYGLHELDIDNTQASKYLKLAINEDEKQAIYELGNLHWRIGEHQKALDMYKEAALCSVREVYQKLGDLYHTGSSGSHLTDSYAIAQNQKTAFAYYSIGGIFGDAKAALKIGEYYEKGCIEDFGIDYNKALRWYKYVSNQLEVPTARSAIGRVKHTLANETKNPSKADELRREAYKEFETAALGEPYAKFMVAVYNLNGWGCQQPDPAFGFDMLLSLVETGFNMALHGIAKCYEQGVSVERDLEKASAYEKLAMSMDAQ
ncbi:hypothetical protein DFQ30_004133 [Apophysomyces sp. BC1015]|nr:hypothetical protein DFQ30_004133 [Apophysomyces sp. BC1015]